MLSGLNLRQLSDGIEGCGFGPISVQMDMVWEHRDHRAGTETTEMSDQTPRHYLRLEKGRRSGLDAISVASVPLCGLCA